MLGLGIGILKVVNYLSSPIALIINAFKSRVAADSGTFEAESCLNTNLTSLVNSGFYEKASLIVTPNAYKASKKYSLKPTDGSGDLTFLRASTAMRRNKAGFWEEVAANVPRLHWNVGATEAMWLNEPTAINQLPYNTVFTGWTSALQSYSNGVQSPIKDVLSRRILVTGAGSNYLLKSLTTTGTRTVTASLFVKNVDYVGNELLTIIVSDGVNGPMIIRYKPSDDTITFSTFYWTNVSVKKTAESQGFTRIEITGTVTSAAGGWFEIVGVNGRSIDIAAPQVVTGSAANSPIITGAAAVTRLADAPVKTGMDLIIPQAEGAFYLDFVLPNLASASVLAEIANASTQNLNFQVSGSTLFWCSNEGGFSISTPITANTRYKVMGLYKANNVKLFVNGVLVASTLVATIHPNLSKFSLGCSTIPANNSLIEIKEARLLPHPTDAAAIAATTI